MISGRLRPNLVLIRSDTHPASTGANLPWLQGKWGGSTACPSTLYDRDPNARATFGSPRAPYIYLRERY